MATNEPMTGERLANMKEHHRTYGGIRMGELLVEIDRLRAREQALAAENAAMRPIVEAVAQMLISADHVYAARTFVAAHLATATAAESEGE